MIRASTAPLQPLVFNDSFHSDSSPQIQAHVPRRKGRISIQSSLFSRSANAYATGDEDLHAERVLAPIRSESKTASVDSHHEISGSHRDALPANEHRDVQSRAILDDETPCLLRDGLQTIIRGQTVKAEGQVEEEFLPNDKLDIIMTESNIAEELKRCSLPTTVAHQVYDQITLPDDRATNRKRLFGILCLTDKVPAIQDILKEHIFDSHLPFQFLGEGVYRQAEQGAAIGERIHFFSNWTNTERDSFKNYQGMFLAPYFKLGRTEEGPFSNYFLPSRTVLPYVEHTTESSKYCYYGGTSEVRRVKIEPSHYDYPGCLTPPTETYFAVKVIHRYEAAKVNQDRELKAYEILNKIGDPHIVNLLATYTLHDQLHLVFPWADGNLYQLWNEEFADIKSLRRDHLLATWFVDQIHGLAKAIVRIHHPTAADLSPEDQAKHHGRHGDFKPENILWFRKPSTSSLVASLGTLMISDLGSTEFHETLSRDVRASAAGAYTATYRAPEYDKMKEISPNADIWSFACVLLEFLVWYTHGREGLKAFTEARLDDHSRSRVFSTDHFFNYDRRERTVAVKDAVTQEFCRVRNASTSDFVVDIANFVESRMLRAEPSDRATCREIASEFSLIKERCATDIKYCTRKMHQILSQSPTDGLGKVHVKLSQEQWEEYTRLSSLVVPVGSRAPSSNGTMRDDNNSEILDIAAKDGSSSKILANEQQKRTIMNEKIQGDGREIVKEGTRSARLRRKSKRYKHIWSEFVVKARNHRLICFKGDSSFF